MTTARRVLCILIGCLAMTLLASRAMAQGVSVESDAWSVVTGQAELLLSGDEVTVTGSGWRRIDANDVVLTAEIDKVVVRLRPLVTPSGWETVGVILQSPVVGVWWQDLGFRLVASGSNEYELTIPPSVRAAAADGAPFVVSLTLNGGMQFRVESVTFVSESGGNPGDDPSGPPTPAAQCSTPQVSIRHIESDFTEIWTGSEEAETGKTVSSLPTVEVEFSGAVRRSELSAYFWGAVPEEGGQPKACSQSSGAALTGNYPHLVGPDEQPSLAALWDAYNGVQLASYNLVATERASGIPDVEGGLAAGSINLANFSVNHVAHSPVGLAVSGGIQVSNGTIVGDLVVPPSWIRPATVTAQGARRAPVAWASDASAAMNGVASAIRELSDTTTTQVHYSTLTIDAQQQLSIVTIDASQLPGIRSLVINQVPGAFLLINVRGNEVRFENVGFSGSFDDRRILWNLPNATYVEMRSVGFQGSMLAPEAYVSAHNGAFDGQLFAREVHGSMEFHWRSLMPPDDFQGAPASRWTIRPRERLMAGCTYRFVLRGARLAGGQDCLAEPVEVDFKVESSSAPPFERETAERRYSASGKLASFKPRPGVRTPSERFIRRYADRMGIAGRVGLTLASSRDLEEGGQELKYQKTVDGLPVHGAGYLVTVDGDGIVSRLRGDLSDGAIADGPLDAGAMSAELAYAALPTELSALVVPDAMPYLLDVPGRGLTFHWRFLVSDEPTAVVLVDGWTGDVRSTLDQMREASGCPGDASPEATVFFDEVRTVPFHSDKKNQQQLSFGLATVDDATVAVATSNEPSRHQVQRDLSLPLNFQNQMTDYAGPAHPSICLGDDEGQAEDAALWSAQRVVQSLESVNPGRGDHWLGHRGTSITDPLYLILGSLPVADFGMYAGSAWIGRDGKPDRVFLPTLTAFPAIIAHELGHFAEVYSRRAWDRQERTGISEDGSAEEAYADIVAAFTLLSAELPPGVDPWCMGIEGPCNRNLRAPLLSDDLGYAASTYGGASWRDYATDPDAKHKNSTVVSHAFYLAAEGGSGVNEHGCEYSVDPMAGASTESRRLAAKLFLAAIASADATSIAAAAEETIYLAEELEVGEQAMNSLKEAWFAVGVRQDPKMESALPAYGANEVNPWSVNFDIIVDEQSDSWTLEISDEEAGGAPVLYPLSALTTYTDALGQRHVYSHIALEPDRNYSWQLRSPGEFGACPGRMSRFHTAKNPPVVVSPASGGSYAYRLTDPTGSVTAELPGAFRLEVGLSETSVNCEEFAGGWYGAFVGSQFFIGNAVSPAESAIWNKSNRVHLLLPGGEDVLPNKTYYLYLRGRRGDGIGSCERLPIRRAEPGPFERIFPMNYDTLEHGKGGPFVWKAASGAKSYRLRISNFNGFVYEEQVQAKDLSVVDGQVSYKLKNPGKIDRGGEMYWLALASSGQMTRGSYDTASAGYSFRSRFWVGAGSVEGGTSEGGVDRTGTFGSDELFVDLTRDSRKPDPVTNRCFDFPANAVGIRYWWMTVEEALQTDWSTGFVDIPLPAASTDRFCTDELPIEDEKMVLRAVAYSSTVNDLPVGFGPVATWGFLTTFCGSEGESCCEMDDCESSTVCSDRQCVHCGGHNELCCDGSACEDADHSCQGNKCKPCGGQDQACCEDDRCSAGNVCLDGATCEACGEAGQPCCDGDECIGTSCVEGICGERERCGVRVEAGSSSGWSTDVFVIDVGKSDGEFRFTYNTFARADAFVIRSSDGAVLWDSSCVSTSQTPHYYNCDPNTLSGGVDCVRAVDLNQRGPNVVVEVEEYCDQSQQDESATTWMFRAECAD